MLCHCGVKGPYGFELGLHLKAPFGREIYILSATYDVEVRPNDFRMGHKLSVCSKKG